MSKMVSIRTNRQILFLLNEIQEHHKNANRTEVLNWALEKATLQVIDWRLISNKKIKEVSNFDSLPQFMQFRVNEEKFKAVSEDIKKTFTLKIVQNPFLIKLVLANYLDSLDFKLDCCNSKFLEEIKGDIWTDDPDDTEEARKFYSEFWGKALNRDIGLFRGETIISFNTIAGCMIRLLPIYDGGNIPKESKGRLDMITGTTELTDTIKSNFKTFHKIYHTLANFMPLVKTEKDYKYAYLQSVKNLDYHEFPDLFFSAVKTFYIDKKRGYIKFSEDNNDKYFKLFGEKETGWKNFVEKNYLHDFFNDNQYNVLKQLAPSSDIRLPYNKKTASSLSYEDKEKCKEYIGVFLENAILIIKNRAKRLSEKY